MKILIITDHRAHTESNSLYPLAKALMADSRCEKVWVISKGMAENDGFFLGDHTPGMEVSEVQEDFQFSPDGSSFLNHRLIIDVNQADVILFRLPQPLDRKLLDHAQSMFRGKCVINSPSGMLETGSKAFLLQLHQLCPTAEWCYSYEEALQRSLKEEIVLKPLYAYGGRGIWRISSTHLWRENELFPLHQAKELLPDSLFPMISMKFFNRVTEGDKRTLVVNKKILGSAIRFPAPGHWVCNVAQGGRAVISAPDEDELAIEAVLTPLLFEKGIILYGFDTLVDDNGKRVLSEINTASIGGIGPMEELSQTPVVSYAAEGILDYASEFLSRQSTNL